MTLRDEIGLARGPAEAPAPEEMLRVVGGNRLRPGTVPVSGFKHALVSCVAAAVGTDGPVRLRACPEIEETRVLARIISGTGAHAEVTGDVLEIDATTAATGSLDPADVAAIHGSVYLMPALLARFGVATIGGSGGCQIGGAAAGRRPVEQYVEVFRRFGATAVERPDGGVEVRASTLRGCTIDLRDFCDDRALRSGPLYSGATKAALLTAAFASGVTTLHHPYPKPDVTELVAFLRAAGTTVDDLPGGGYAVHGAGGPLRVTGVEHHLVPDLIEIVTWVCAGALLGSGPIRLEAPRLDAAAQALAPERAVLDQLGVAVEWSADAAVVHPAEALAPIDVVVASHGVFSDSQPLLALLALRAEGTSSIAETVWSSRFTYAEGLRALGADIRVDGPRAEISGPWRPRAGGPTPLHARDLRAAAALLLAALEAPRTSELTGVHHLRRGYPDLAGTLIELGADITRPHQGAP